MHPVGDGLPDLGTAHVDPASVIADARPDLAIVERDQHQDVVVGQRLDTSIQVGTLTLLLPARARTARPQADPATCQPGSPEPQNA